MVLTPALVAAEVHRINTTTRAPEMLAEIKTALGNDPEKLARVFAKPILVERLLRDKAFVPAFLKVSTGLRLSGPEYRKR